MPLRRVSIALPPGRLTVRFYTSQTNPVTIGIRREDPLRIWERRAPLTPDAVAALVSRDNVRVIVQECERRVFPIEEYIRVRAIYVRDSEFIIERLRHSGRCGGALHARTRPPGSWHQGNTSSFSSYESNPLCQSQCASPANAHDVLPHCQRPGV